MCSKNCLEIEEQYKSTIANSRRTTAAAVQILYVTVNELVSQKNKVEMDNISLITEKNGINKSLFFVYECVLDSHCCSSGFPPSE